MPKFLRLKTTLNHICCRLHNYQGYYITYIIYKNQQYLCNVVRILKLEFLDYVFTFFFEMPLKKYVKSRVFLFLKKRKTRILELWKILYTSIFDCAMPILSINDNSYKVKEIPICHVTVVNSSPSRVAPCRLILRRAVGGNSTGRVTG